MADKRMFTKKITESDAFLDMPLSTQCLYFHLNMNADDDGFVNNYKKIIRMINATKDDMQLLLVKNFLINFEEEGVIVIKHWWLHNYLRSDRYKETEYQDLKSLLHMKENKVYTLQDVPLIEEKKETKHKYGMYNNVLLTDDQLAQLKNEFVDWSARIERLSEYIASTGKVYKNHLATIRNWSRKEKPSKTEELEIYDDSNNPEFNEDKRKELLRRRNNNE